MTRRLPRSLDEAVSNSPRTRLFQQTPDSAQATMQVTSTSVLKSIARDQSLAQSSTKADKMCNETVRQATGKTTWNYMTSDQSLAGLHALRRINGTSMDR